MRHRHEIRTLSQAYLYNLDCNLATVEDMASRKSSPKGELKRQIEMAQVALDWLREFCPDLYGAGAVGTRAYDVCLHYNGNVGNYANAMRP